MDMVVAPHKLVAPDSALRLHGVYYITKQIVPALERVMQLLGVNVRAWCAGDWVGGPGVQGYRISRLSHAGSARLAGRCSCSA